jgi:Malic enzyme, N-terminal domain
MCDHNAVLFYRLLAMHLEEMLPIVYPPRSRERSNATATNTAARAVFLSVNHPEQVEESLRNYGLNDGSRMSDPPCDHRWTHLHHRPGQQPTCLSRTRPRCGGRPCPATQRCP